MNSISICLPKYEIYVDDGAGNFILFADENLAYDVFAISSDSSSVIITTTPADSKLHLQTKRVRVTVASVADFNTAFNPVHLYFSVTFTYDHVCLSAIFNDDGGLVGTLD